MRARLSRSLRSSVWFVVAASGLVGCARACGSGAKDDDSISSDPGRRPATKKDGPVDPCVGYASTYCAGLSRCDPSWFVRGYGDFPRCTRAIERYCNLELHAPGSGDTEAIIAQCAHGYTVTSCDDWMTGLFPETCEPPGSIKLGGGCSMPAQCESYSCNKTTADRCGKCVKRALEGQSCGVGECMRGLACRGYRCQKPDKAGAPCSSDDDCVFSTLCLDGLCTAPFKAGDACDPEKPCDRRRGEECLAGKCTFRKLGKKGAPCSGDSDCEGGICNRGKGVCTPLGDLGDACDAAAGSPCFYPQHCIGGRCAMPDVSPCP